MPLQNRVDPFGRIFRTPARGTMMGNRGGALHNQNREIVRVAKGRRWIACVLEFKDRRRTVMAPGRYTELFFLDEAVAMAAGHRPCAECRRGRYEEFRRAWSRWSGGGLPGADAMDAALDRARMGRGREKITFEAEAAGLPEGSFLVWEEAAWLVWHDGLWLWTPEGYARRRPRENSRVTVLTPRPMVECMAAGYRPEVHESAGRL